MTITLQTTRRGKEIHRLSPGDLIDVVESGERLRASCPIHGGDNQRSLSVDRASGWGFCHCCHATVLVTPTGSGLVGGRSDGPLQRSARNNIPAFSPRTGHSSSLSERTSPIQQRHAVTTTPTWQQEEVAAITTIIPLTREALASSRRAQVYLGERGIPLAVARTSGIGYLSHAIWEQATVAAEQQALLKRWIGRIIFPLGSPAGQGFIGRALLRWEPGMNEDTHKALLDRPDAPRRWIKTNPAGWFGLAEISRLTEWVVLVEGSFDRLALLAAGFPTGVVVALVGTAARPTWLARLAPQVKGVVLALDADEGGQVAMERLAHEFRQAGLTVVLCPPPLDRWGKDWSERWRRIGPQSIWPILETYALLRRDMAQTSTT